MRWGCLVSSISIIFISSLFLSPIVLARRVNRLQLSQAEIFNEAGSLIKQAEEVVGSGDYTAALLYLKNAIRSQGYLSDPLERAGILVQAASLYQKIDYNSEVNICIEEAQELLIQCRDIALSVEDKILSAICFTKIARCYLLMGDINSQNSSMAQVSSIMYDMTCDEIADIDINNFRTLASSMVLYYQGMEGVIFEGSFMQEFLIRFNKARAYFQDNEGGIQLAQCEEMEAFLYDKLGAYGIAIKFYKRAAHRYEGLSAERGGDSDLTYTSADLSFRAAELCLEIYRAGGEKNIDERDSAAKSFALASRSYELVKDWEKASESSERAFEINRDRGEYGLASRSILWAAMNRRRYAYQTGEAVDRMKEASLWVMRGDMLREHAQEITEIDAEEEMLKVYQEARAAYKEAYDIYREQGDLAGMRESIVSREQISGYLNYLN
ncbi:MAG: hypothetical protein P9X27_02250 [Candidatus Kaelpia aquatica]|nr:hypothetical protein [Candidatus Kaelpia aquatica]